MRRGKKDARARKEEFTKLNKMQKRRVEQEERDNKLKIEKDERDRKLKIEEANAESD